MGILAPDWEKPPKKGDLTAQEKEDAAWLKDRPSLDENRRLIHAALRDGFHEKTFEVWKDTEYGELLGCVASLVKVLKVHGVDGMQDMSKEAFPMLMTLTALVAEKAEHYHAGERSVREIMMIAYGFYVKVEPYKMDTWQDLPLTDLILHLAHEVEEIKRGKTLERRMHNAIDALPLEAMLWVRQQALGLNNLKWKRFQDGSIKLG